MRGIDSTQPVSDTIFCVSCSLFLRLVGTLLATRRLQSRSLVPAKPSIDSSNVSSTPSELEDTSRYEDGIALLHTIPSELNKSLIASKTPNRFV